MRLSSIDWSPVCCAIGALLGTEGQALVLPAEETSNRFFPEPARTHIIEIAGEQMATDDIRLTDLTFRYANEQDQARWMAQFSASTIRLDYLPVIEYDPLAYETTRREPRHSLSLERRQPVDSRLTWLISAAGYVGYTDYRSLWIDTFYEQQYGNVRGYQESNPMGVRGDSGLRWPYAGESGILEVHIGYSYDRVVPAFEIDPESFDLVVRPLREELGTFTARISSENVLGDRVRWLNELWLADTTGRDPRLGLQSSANWAPVNRLIARLSAGYAREEPEFEAWFAGGTIEVEPLSFASVFVTGRYYADTGEIENALNTSTAAPGAQTWQVAGGIRCSWQNTTIQLLAGPYHSSFDEVGPGTIVFRNLYRDRDWFLVQGAVSVRF